MDLPNLDIEMDDLNMSLEDLINIELLEASFLSETRNNMQSQSDSDKENEITYPTTWRKRRHRRVIASDSESETDSVANFVAENLENLRQTSTTYQKWSRPRGYQPSVIPFTESTGMKQPYASELKHAAEGDYFKLMVPDTVFEKVAAETNLFAEQNNISTKPQSRCKDWKPTSRKEIKQFFGLLLYMGLVKLPQINLYWSKDRVFGQSFAPSVMSRNRFELILRMLHFTNNETGDKSDRIFKIRPIIDALNENFSKHYSRKEDVCVDESQVPYRGRIIFRQYNKSKRHKYGMKLFKLCTIPGYTCRLELYAGKNHETVNTSPSKVVLSLCDHILNLGHTLATDNWYTSLDLANELLDKDTHLVGTLRKNRRGLPKNVVEAKLRPGETIAMENERGICVLKWKDKRDVLMLSTKHSKSMTTVMKKGKTVRKPKMVLAYNKAKGAVDMSDQMTSYSTPLRKTIKWYKKLAIELILNTALVNSWVMYKENKRTKISIVQFRRQLVEYLVDAEKDEPNLTGRPRRLRHELIKKEGPVRKTRRFCVECYKECVNSFGPRAAKNKAKKVTTYCDECPNKPYLCLTCFNKRHRFA